ncbi:MAG TPA: hypothetical protein VFX39_08495 [Gemmatimonadaceae bacterium]|nr:hypothetical protein [Gemmatimonadaceae bacterium]
MSATPDPTPVRVDAPSGRVVDMSITQSDPTKRFSLEATPDAVWAVLPAVYAELHIPVTTLVASSRRIGNSSYRVRRQLGGQRMSRFLACGERLGLEVADTDDITLHVETVVAPGDSGAALTTLVVGSARPVGVAGHPINCATTGRLEQRIIALVQAKLPK